MRPVPMDDGVPVDYWVYRQPSRRRRGRTRGRTPSALLGAFRDAVTADGARFVVMVVTAREQIYPDDWQQLLGDVPGHAAGGLGSATGPSGGCSVGAR